jgi:hypothetical protein
MKARAKKAKEFKHGTWNTVDEINALTPGTRAALLERVSTKHGHMWFRRLCETLNGSDARSAREDEGRQDWWVIRIVLTAGHIRGRDNSTSELVSAVTDDANEYIRDMVGYGKQVEPVVVEVRNALVGWRNCEREQAKQRAS